MERSWQKTGWTGAERGVGGRGATTERRAGVTKISLSAERRRQVGRSHALIFGSRSVSHMRFCNRSDWPLLRTICAREKCIGPCNASVERDVIKVVLGRPLERLQEGSGGYPSLDAQHTVRKCWILPFNSFITLTCVCYMVRLHCRSYNPKKTDLPCFLRWFENNVETLAFVIAQTAVTCSIAMEVSK